MSNRNDTIRTCDPCFPKAVLYQTELHSETEGERVELSRALTPQRFSRAVPSPIGLTLQLFPIDQRVFYDGREHRACSICLSLFGLSPTCILCVLVVRPRVAYLSLVGCGENQSSKVGDNPHTTHNNPYQVYTD